MPKQEAFIKLRTILADLYPDTSTARRVAGDATLNASRITFSGAAVNIWQSVLKEAENTGKIEALFAIVLSADEYADNPALQEACAAYRQATGQASSPPVTPVQEQPAETATPKPPQQGRIKILFLAANPTDTTQLRLGEEVREIDLAIRSAEFRERFEIEQAWAVRATDLLELLMRHRPHIVHFSGHGIAARAGATGGEGRNAVLVSVDGSTSEPKTGQDLSQILLEDAEGNSRPVSPVALSRVFALLKDNIRCVVLNACYSEGQAQAIAQQIDVVVGMSTAIGDKAAIAFATAFYRALGYGRDIKTAFESGVTELMLRNIPEDKTPKLLANNIDPTQLIL